MTNQLPAHLQQYQTPDIGATAIANLGTAMPPHVSIGNGRFTLIDAANNEIAVPTFDPQIGPYLDACIVDVADVMSRIYFAGNYDPSAEGTRPDCFSDNGVGPSIASSSPQAPTCAACPRSEWTKVNANGKKVPWCSHKYKIAIIVPGFPTLFLLAVPPNSHGPLREYLASCKGNGINPANLVTRMWFVSQGTLGFAPRPGGPAMAYIDAATAALRQAAYAEKKTDALVGRTDVARPATAILGVAGQIAPNSTGQAPLLATQPGSTMQVQPPAPFPAANPAASSTWPVTPQSPASAGPAAPAAAEPTTRRRRRTAAEMAQAAPQGPNGAAPAPTAPFPHPGQQTQPQGTQAFVANAPSQQAPQGNFGVAEGQPVPAELKSTLDSFFKD
jgi:hypothetical protein